MTPPSTRRFRLWGAKGNTCAVLVTAMLLMWGRLLLKEMPRVSTAEPMAQEPAVNLDAALGPSAQESIDLSGIKPLARDLFAFDPSPYNRTQLPVFAEQALRPEAKSPDPDAVVASLLKELNRLQIQSLMDGNPARVMIDGRVLVPGDVINGFQISAIDYALRTVDFRREGHTLRLKP